MKRFTNLAAGFALVACLALPLAHAQSGLPPEAQARILIVQAQNAFDRGDEASALAALGELTARNLPRPPTTLILEARLAGRAKDYPRVRRVLEAYFKAAKPDDAQYDEAAQLYAAVDELERQEAARQAAAAKAADEAAWTRANTARTCESYTGYLMQAKAPAAFAPQAIQGLESLSCALPAANMITSDARTAGGAALTQALSRERARIDAAAQVADRAAWDRLIAQPSCETLFAYYTTSPPPRAFAGEALDRMRSLRCTTLPAAGIPASTRAPVLARGAQPAPFQMFRDCANCPDMIALPGGSFLMGSPETEQGRRSDEAPQITVTLQAFAVGRFEVTFDDWALCVREGGCQTNRRPSDYGWGRATRPVIYVSWANAQEYVQWLSQKTGHRYRLLSESEWEYAARAGTNTRWSFGDSEGQLGAYAWFSANSQSRTQLVGAKLANPWGLYDMHGNVWEWVEDCYVSGYRNAPTNGSAVATGLTTGDCHFVLRGGSWYDYPWRLRSADRARFHPAGPGLFHGVGFRLARTL